jgi:hypothetical protein
VLVRDVLGFDNVFPQVAHRQCGSGELVRSPPDITPDRRRYAMADRGQLVTQELQATATEEQTPMPAVPQVTSVANPRRIRLSRLAQDASQTH